LISLVSLAAWTLYVAWPAHGWGLFEGLPISPLATVAIAALWLGAAVSSRRIVSSAWWPVGFLILKVVASAALVDRGFVASYFANDTFTPPVQRSIDFPRAPFTRIDPTLDFGRSSRRDLPLYFLSTDSASHWSAIWTGFLHVERDETVTIFLRGRGITGDLAIDDAHLVALGDQSKTLGPGSGALDADIGDERAVKKLQAGWHALRVAVRAPLAAERELYCGFIDPSGIDRGFGDPDVFPRPRTAWRITLDRAVRGVSWLLDVILIAVFGVRIGWRVVSALTASWANLIGLGFGIAVFANAIGVAAPTVNRLVLFDGASLAVIHFFFGEGPFGVVFARQLAAGLPIVILGAVVATLVARRPITSSGVRDGSPHRLDRTDLTFALSGIGLYLMFVLLPHAMTGDGLERYKALTELLEHGRLSSMAYSLIGPLFSAPLFYLGKVVGGAEWWVGRFNTLLIVGGVVGLGVLLRRRVDLEILGTFLLLLVAASMFPNHSRDYYGEVFTGISVALGAAALATDRSILGWSLMVTGVVNTPATIVGLLLVSFRHIWRNQRLRHLLPLIAAALLIVIEAWLRRGGPFTTGYEGNAGAPTVLPYSGRLGFSYPLFLGLMSILLSFGKGVVFFAPGLLLPIRERDIGPSSRVVCECYATWMWFLAGMVLVYAKWWAWYGGWFWGPRFFLIASLPASLALAVRLRNAKKLSLVSLVVVAVILAWSVWVGTNGAVFDQAGLGRCMQDDYALELLCWYTPEFSALWRPFLAPWALSASQALFDAYCVVALAWLAWPLLKQLRFELERHPIEGAVARLRAMRF
jgi:hypothetical protein